MIKTGKTCSVRFPEAYKDAAQVGSIWRVEGEITNTEYWAAGQMRGGHNIEATNVEFVKPRTGLLEAWLRENIEGVGYAKARKLACNPLLERAIEAGDPTNFLGLSDVAREQLLRKFPRDEFADVLRWLAERDLPTKLANSIASIWREESIRLLEDNPFRLLQFGLSWTQVQKVAKEFNFTSKHPKYKAGETVFLMKRFFAGKQPNSDNRGANSTLMPRRELERVCSERRIDMREHVRCAFEQEFITYVKDKDAFQLEGEFLLEHAVGARLRNAILRANGEGSEFAQWELYLTENRIRELLKEYESTIPYSLTDEQRDAVRRACTHKVISLSGGAGTGKTTILRAILYVLEKASEVTFDEGNVAIHQIALSGRASQRMSEATNRPASTIAKFVIDMKNIADDKRPDHAICVIDEASMVDLYSMANLLDYLPFATRFIFVGDVHQLPPVSGGLVFHELMKSDFPSVTLNTVKRQAIESGIHKFATAVRNEESGITLPSYHPKSDIDCSFVNSIEPEVIGELFAANGGINDCIILSSMNKHYAGVQNLNKLLQRTAGYDRPALSSDTEDGFIRWQSFSGNQFLLGDPVLVTKNDYTLGVRNGDLGVITEVYTEPNDADVMGKLTIGSRVLDITEELLMKLDHGFAITIHKSQGSQWKNVILVLDRAAENMLDKTLIYTGATRAQKKLIVCGEDAALIDDAVSKGAIAQKRNTNLLKHLQLDIYKKDFGTII